ncbi:YveK family protein [Paenibacillus wynnii]|uniref:YveK family protein n=1 Tax=Paenibacillus wynnii TaxID=268407 RepID=UPI0027D7B10A|nr:Wzz/FepE/Etk N-terminal domain-containing protein [Paenibacillus wynnii]
MEEELIMNERAKTFKSPVKEINLKELFSVITRRLWIVLLSTALLGFLGGLYSSIPETPMYASSARLMLASGSPEMLSTLRALLREPVVMEKAIKDLNLKMSVGALRENVSVGSVDNSIITIVTVFDANPKLTAGMANAVVKAFTDEAKKKLQFYGASVLSDAVTSPDPVPINPPSNRALYLGIIMGLVIGVGITFLLDSLDDTLRSEDDLEKYLGIKPLGSVSKISKKDHFGKVKRKNEYIRGETIGS